MTVKIRLDESCRYKYAQTIRCEASGRYIGIPAATGRRDEQAAASIQRAATMERGVTAAPEYGPVLAQD